MLPPEEEPTRRHNEPENDVERPTDRVSEREAEEITDANIRMNDEFIDAGNESRIDADDVPPDDLDAAVDDGIAHIPPG